MSRKAWWILAGPIAVSGLPFVGLLVLGLPSDEPPHPIPDGVYLSDSGDERITVAGKRMRFHVRDTNRGPRAFIQLEYDYTVYRDGRVVTYVMTSADALYGPVGRYKWTWDGTAITREDVRDSEPTVTFVRQATSGP